MKATQWLIVALALTCVASPSACGTLITEDFQQDGDPSIPGFDPVFNHQIGPDEFGLSSIVYDSFTESRFVSANHSLFLAPATDYITFNLEPGQFVDYAEVWLTSNQNDPPAYFHVIGTEGELLVDVPGSFSSPLTRVDTVSSNLGEIVEIRLTGFEGYFDDLTINVVPEPGMIFLFIMAGLFWGCCRKKRLGVLVSLTLLSFFAQTTRLSGEPICQPGELPGEEGTQSQQPPAPLSPPGSELVDIVFVLDGSGSILDADWSLEKAGVRNCFYGPNAFIPSDGTVAIAVIQFTSGFPGAQVEIPLTTIDNSNTAEALAGQVDSISQDGGGTDLEPGLKTAVDVLRTGSGLERLIVVATDISADGTQAWLDLGNEIRTGTGYADGLGQTRICTVYINACSVPPEDTPNEYLRKLANRPGRPASPTFPGSAHRPLLLRVQHHCTTGPT